MSEFPEEAEQRWIFRRVQAGPAALFLQTDAPPSPELARYLGAWRTSLARAGNDDDARYIYAAPKSKWQNGPPLLDVIPGYAGILIAYDPDTPPERVEAWARRHMPAHVPGVEASRVHEVRVAYGEGADRDALQARLGRPFAEIVELHASATYTVAFIGFTAGFPYLLGLPPALRLPRMERPRERMPAGAVAIAGGQAGIYPTESPGGWWVLGRTEARLFDPQRHPPALLATGDTVRFRAMASGSRGFEERGGADSGPAAPGEAPTERDAPELEVLEAWPRSLTLQGAPRHGVGHWGMAQAGALDPLAHGEANAILGNPSRAAALEAVGNAVSLTARAPLRAVVTGGGLVPHLEGRARPRWQAFDWPAGGVLELVPGRAASGYTSYLAVRGGFAAEHAFGSPSTDPRAGVGGSRRYLRAGDVIRAQAPGSSASERPYFGTPRYPERVVLRLHPGPQHTPDAMRHLERSSFRVAVLDRTGVRLSGPAMSLDPAETLSEGSPAGSVQIPPDGAPILLLADRGRTGGYAKPAIVDPRDLWRLAQAGPGTEIWFAPIGAPDAHREPVHWKA